MVHFFRTSCGFGSNSRKVSEHSRILHFRTYQYNEVHIQLTENIFLYLSECSEFNLLSYVWLTVHDNSVWIRKPTRCRFLYSLFLL